MVIKIIYKKIYFILFLLHLQIIGAQKKNDSLETWIAGFANYHNLRLSEDNRWLLVTKSYNANADTLLIYDTEHPGKPNQTLIKMNVRQGFLGRHALIAQGQDTAEYIRFKDSKKVKYSNVKKIEVLSTIKRYVILDNNNTLSVYNADAQKINEIKHVEDYVTDEKNFLVAIITSGNSHNIVNILENNTKRIYTTSNYITGTLSFPVGKWVSFTETDAETKKIRSLFINTKTGNIQFPLGDTFIEADNVSFSEIHGGEAFLIDFVKWKTTDKHEIVDIWYGNDKFLRSKNAAIGNNEYWYWKSGIKSAEKIAIDSFTDYVSINSDRFFLAFNIAEQFDYRFSTPVYALYLYDRITKTSKKIVEGTRDTVISADGRYIVMLNEIKQQWELYDTLNTESRIIDKSDLESPFFSEDNFLMFESKNGLHIYNLERNSFDKTLLSGKKTIIIKKQFRHQLNKKGASFGICGAAGFQKFLICAQDRASNLNSYYRWNEKKLHAVIHNTGYQVNDIKFSEAAPSFITIEESYNQMPQVYLHNLGKNTKTCISSDLPQQMEIKIRREIIFYKNSKGRDLQGILFYPIHFDSSKKYPIVVKIYQEQGSLSNKYLKPMFSEDGSNTRLLIEKDYFVFLPDTVVDERGPGTAALDCVHSALDILEQFSYIDKTKIGLVGHSFGGYETNFIATHSDRFTTYISGAGVSHLTSRYYLYNQDYGYIEYSKIENSQYAMKLRFSEAKEKYIQNNPVYFADKIHAPILIWAGMKDRNVPYEQSLAFYIALLRERKEVIAMLYPNQGHAFDSESREAKDLNIRSLQWWDYFLKDKKEIKWINEQIKRMPSG